MDNNKLSNETCLSLDVEVSSLADNPIDHFFSELKDDPTDLHCLVHLCKNIIDYHGKETLESNKKKLYKIWYIPNNADHNEIFWIVVFTFVKKPIGKINLTKLTSLYNIFSKNCYKTFYRNEKKVYDEKTICNNPSCCGNAYLSGNINVGCECFSSEDYICEDCEGDYRVDYNDSIHSYFLWNDGCTCFTNNV